MPPATLPRAINRFQRAAIGLQKAREKDVIAEKHLPEIQQFFQKQADMVLLRFSFAMREYFPQPAPETPRQMGAKQPANPAALKKWREIWDNVEYGTTPDLQEIITATEKDALIKGADQLHGLLNPGGITPTSPMFNLANPRAVAFFKKTGGSVDYIRGIQDTTAAGLKSVITTALDGGWSYNATAKEIRKLFDGPISRERAQLIATHEAAQAYEAGNRAFADSLKDDGIVMEKMWVTSHDDRVSDGCRENEDAGWIPIDEPFPSGDQEPPRFPGCRCYAIYREAPQGRE